jgi:hypothetical protein
MGVNATCSIMANWAATATPKPAFMALRLLIRGVLKSFKGIGNTSPRNWVSNLRPVTHMAITRCDRGWLVMSSQYLDSLK